MTQIELQSMPEPQIWWKDNVPCYFDPASKRLRQKTPEETIRQKLIRFLHEKMSVPYEAITVEEPVSHYVPGASGRVDVLVCGYNQKENTWYPLLVAECKAPQIQLTEEVYAQVDSYAAPLGAAFSAVTNGLEFWLDRWDEASRRYQTVTSLPDYHALCGFGVVECTDEPAPPYQRMDFSSLDSNEMYEDIMADGAIIGEDTPRAIVPFALNLVDCFLDESVRCNGLPVNKLKFIEDLGCRHTVFGNAGGGAYSGPYRTLMLDEDGDTKLVGAAIFSTQKIQNDGCGETRRGVTSLCVSIDDKDSHHLSLQLCLDRFVSVVGTHVHVWHDGRMTCGNLGSLKRSEVLDYIAHRAPHLLGTDGMVELGVLENGHAFTLDEPQLSDFMSRLVQYALLRDELRLQKKAKKAKK